MQSFTECLSWNSVIHFVSDAIPFMSDDLVVFLEICVDKMSKQMKLPTKNLGPYSSGIQQSTLGYNRAENPQK